MPEPAELFKAIANGKADEARSLIEADAALARARNDQGVSAFMFAMYNDRRELAQAMIEAGHEPDVFEAAAMGLAEKAAATVESEHDALKAFTLDGFTLLHYACYFNQPEIAIDLLQRGAEVNVHAENDSRVTPLHSAAAAGSPPLVKMLLEHGAEPDARQAGGFTALMSAALHGDTDMARALLEAGADPETQADDGRSAMIMAQQSDHDAVVQLIQEQRPAKGEDPAHAAGGVIEPDAARPEREIESERMQNMDDSGAITLEPQPEKPVPKGPASAPTPEPDDDEASQARPR